MGTETKWLQLYLADLKWNRNALKYISGLLSLGPSGSLQKLDRGHMAMGTVTVWLAAMQPWT